jgi:hypothetical protein
VSAPILDHFPESDFSKWIAPLRQPAVIITPWAGWEGQGATYVLEGQLPPEGMTNHHTVCQTCRTTFITAAQTGEVVSCPNGHRTAA